MAKDRVVGCFFCATFDLINGRLSNLASRVGRGSCGCKALAPKRAWVVSFRMLPQFIWTPFFLDNHSDHLIIWLQFCDMPSEVVRKKPTTPTYMLQECATLLVRCCHQMDLVMWIPLGRLMTNVTRLSNVPTQLPATTTKSWPPTFHHETSNEVNEVRTHWFVLFCTLSFRQRVPPHLEEIKQQKCKANWRNHCCCNC